MGRWAEHRIPIMEDSKQWWDASEDNTIDSEMKCGRRVNMDRFCQEEASQAARHLWQCISSQNPCSHGEDLCGVSWSALRFGYYFCQMLRNLEKGSEKDAEITLSTGESDKSDFGVDCVDCSPLASPDPDLTVVTDSSDSAVVSSRRTPSPDPNKRSTGSASRRASEPYRFQSPSSLSRQCLKDDLTTDGQMSPLPRTNSDSSQSTKASFLRRMSFKGLFSKSGIDSKMRTLPRVLTSASLLEKDPVSEIGMDSEAFTRPRLSSAPASQLDRLRPANRSTGAQLSTQTVSSSLLNLPQRLRKNSVSSLSGRQSPQQTSLLNEVIPEHATDGKRIADILEGASWFHGEISRAGASTQVVNAGNGSYLVRPSESRPGEFVLTFNAHGKPKHIRFLVNGEGRCRVQSSWFESVGQLLDHYHTNPLPLESDHSPNSLLTQHVSSDSAQPRSTGDSISLPSAQSFPPSSSSSSQRFCRSVSPSSANPA